MKKLIIKVTPTDVQIISKPEKITAGNVEYLECEFQLDSAFDGLIVRASFDGDYRTVEGNTCFAPPLNAGLCKLGVYGYILTGDNQFKQVISPEPTKFYVNEGSYSATDKESSNPPPSELESYYQKTKDLLDNSTQEVYEQLLPQLNGKLNVRFCTSSEDVANVMYELQNNFSSFAPVLLMPMFDDIDNGIMAGVGYIFVDSGSGSFENALALPICYSEYPFTYGWKTEVDDVVSKSKDNILTILSTESGTQGLYSYCKLSKYLNAQSISGLSMHTKRVIFQIVPIYIGEVDAYVRVGINKISNVYCSCKIGATNAPIIVEIEPILYFNASGGKGINNYFVKIIDTEGNITTQFLSKTSDSDGYKFDSIYVYTETSNGVLLGVNAYGEG